MFCVVVCQFGLSVGVCAFGAVVSVIMLGVVVVVCCLVRVCLCRGMLLFMFMFTSWLRGWVWLECGLGLGLLWCFVVVCCAMLSCVSLCDWCVCGIVLCFWFVGLRLWFWFPCAVWFGLCGVGLCYGNVDLCVCVYVGLLMCACRWCVYMCVCVSCGVFFVWLWLCVCVHCCVFVACAYVYVCMCCVVDVFL